MGHRQTFAALQPAQKEARFEPGALREGRCPNLPMQPNQGFATGIHGQIVYQFWHNDKPMWFWMSRNTHVRNGVLGASLLDE